MLRAEAERRARIRGGRGQRPQKSRVRNVRHGFSRPRLAGGAAIAWTERGALSTPRRGGLASALLLPARATINTAALRQGLPTCRSRRRPASAGGRWPGDERPAGHRNARSGKSWNSEPEWPSASLTHDDPAGEIIEIDQQIHDLLMRRATLLREPAHAARPAAAGAVLLRPGEDAATVRRIVDRHKGDFPLRAVVRIWREILTASLSAEAQLCRACLCRRECAGLLGSGAHLFRLHPAGHRPCHAPRP